MLNKWGAWFGTEEAVDDVSERETSCNENNKPSDPHPLLQKAKGFTGFMYNFASSASKNLSESVLETAQTLKKSVEEGKINGIIDQTFLGDFQKEQEKFVQEKKAKTFGVAVPPWVGYNEEDTVQQQILALSADKRNFLRDPPAGVQFPFDFEQMYPVAMVILEEDELLRKMRFHLVPKQVKEEAFWRNYFYRVSLIKQSAQLTALQAAQGAVKDKTPAAKPKLSEDEVMNISTSPAFDLSEINKEVLVLGQEETPDWERELQEELKEYDVLADNENHDHENWDQEIEDMLKEESESH